MAGRLAIGRTAIGWSLVRRLAFRRLAFGRLAIGRSAIGWSLVRRLVFGRLVFRRLVFGWFLLGRFVFGWLGFRRARRLVVMAGFGVVVVARVFTVIACVVGNAVTEVAGRVAWIGSRRNDRLGWDRRLGRCARTRAGARICAGAWIRDRAGIDGAARIPCGAWIVGGRISARARQVFRRRVIVDAGLLGPRRRNFAEDRLRVAGFGSQDAHRGLQFIAIRPALRLREARGNTRREQQRQ